MFRKVIMLIISIALINLELKAQNAIVNSNLQELIKHAFAYFPKVKEAENAITLAQEKITFSNLANSATVNAGAAYTYVNPVPKFNFGGNEILFQPHHNLNTSVNANYTLFDFGRLKAQVDRTKTDLQLAEQNKAALYNQLSNQVATIYYNIIYLKQALALEDSLLSFLSENKKITDNKLKNGDALKLDVLTLLNSIDVELNKKTDFENALKKQFILLQYTTGSAEAVGNQFDFTVPQVTMQEALSIAAKENPDFAIAKIKEQQIEKDLALTKLTDKPIVQIQSAAGIKNGLQPNIYQLRFNYLAGIGINIPIYNGGKTKQQIKINEVQLKQNQLANNTLQNSYQKDIEQTLSDIASNNVHLKTADSQIQQALYAQQIAAARYQNDAATSLELLNASNGVLKARLNSLQYRYQLCLAKVELARIMAIHYW